MHQIIIVLASLFLGGCFGAQVRQAPPQAPAPSPSSISASMKGSHSLLLLTSAQGWERANKAITSNGMEVNGRAIVLPVRLWDGKAWGKVAKAAFFHWAPGAQLSAAQERAVAEADVVVACYASTLPPHAKAKAWILSKGITQAWAAWGDATSTLIQGMDKGKVVEEDDDALAAKAAQGLGK